MKLFSWQQVPPQPMRCRFSRETLVLGGGRGSLQRQGFGEMIPGHSLTSAHPARGLTPPFFLGGGTLFQRSLFLSGGCLTLQTHQRSEKQLLQHNSGLHIAAKGMNCTLWARENWSSEENQSRVKATQITWGQLRCTRLRFDFVATANPFSRTHLAIDHSSPASEGGPKESEGFLRL